MLSVRMKKGMNVMMLLFALAVNENLSAKIWKNSLSLVFLKYQIFNHMLRMLGEHSKITLNTRNVFIESTATDIHKV